MKIFLRLTIYLVSFFCLAIVTASAQQTEQQRVAIEREQRQQQIFQSRIEQAGNQPPLRGVPPGAYAIKKKNGSTDYMPLFFAVTVPLSPEDQARLTPAEGDFEKYKEFLKNSDAGLAKILPDPNCSSEFVIDLNDSKCGAALSIPGRGAFFSFRVKRNFPLPYADIHFDDGAFKVGGKSELGIISKLGDIKIENIELTTPGITPIHKFKPAKTEAEIRKQEEQVNKGFSAEGFTYSSKAAVELNQTYVVRTIAFRHYEQYFNDRRIDILIVFRVVKRDADGALTILWRRLSKNSSPQVTR